MVYFMENPTKMDDLGVPVYRQWFAELAGRYNASEEECKKQHAAAKVELRNVAQKVLLGTSDPSETTNQSLVVGGMCRIHCVATQDLMQKVNTVTEQWITRWCAERGVGAETVAVLVVVDLSNKSRIPEQIAVSANGEKISKSQQMIGKLQF